MEKIKMEKKEREQLRERMEKHEFLSGGLYRSDIYHDPNQTGNTSGYITTVTENVLDFILEELEKAREEGRKEGINAVLFPKFKRDKNGTLKREGWVNTSKLKQ